MINPVTGENFTVADVDRILGLADQFMEDWEGDVRDNCGKDEECEERREEWDALRPLILAVMKEKLEGLVRTPATPELIEAARDRLFVHGTGNDIEIDEDAVISQAENGTWVSGWVWVEGATSEDEDDDVSAD